MNSRCWLMRLLSMLLALPCGCIGVADDVIVPEGEGAIAFGSAAFLAVLGHSDSLEVVGAFGPTGSRLNVEGHPALNLGAEYCVELGFDISSLRLLVARVDPVQNDNEACSGTSGLPCRAVCRTSSTTWRVSRA